MESFDALEERIASLEERILGGSGSSATLQSREKASLVDTLLHASQLLNSALSGRDKSLSVMNRISELNNYVDPCFESSEMTCEAKLEVILAQEDELRQCLRRIEEAQHLVPSVLDNQSAISNMEAVAGLSGQLEKLTLITIDSVQGVENLNQQAQELFERYNSIVRELSRAFILLDDLVTAQEQMNVAHKSRR